MMPVMFGLYSEHNVRVSMKKRITNLSIALMACAMVSGALQASSNFDETVSYMDEKVEDGVSHQKALNRYEKLRLQQKLRKERLEKQAFERNDPMKKKATEDEQEKNRVMIGRDYYHALVDVSMQRHWAFPITCNVSFVNGAFDAHGQRISAGAAALGGTPALADIYLFSRLGDQNLVGNLSATGGGQPASKSRVVGQNDNIPFGAFADDLYTTLLAPMKVGACLQQWQSCTDFTAMYRFDIVSCNRVFGYVGATLPLKTASVQADVQLQDGSLYIEAFSSGQTVNRERTLTQFFDDYEDVQDFFTRAVLGSKGIAFSPSQTKVGLGDFSLFGIIDIGGLWRYTDGLQFGLTILFPTGSAANPNMLFNPSFSNGAYTFEPFFNAIFNSPSAVFNPAFKVVGSFSLARSSGSSGGTRIASVVSNDGRVQVKNIAGLSFPARFVDYYASAFNEVASTVPLFADSAVPATVKLGNKLFVGVGNYFFNVFNLGFRLGVFYDYIRKGSDSACVDKCYGTFDTASFVARTEQRSHSIGVNLTYKFRNMLELNCGGEFVIGGKNIPRTNDFFVSIIAVF
jgi:hypothetical protein